MSLYFFPASSGLSAQCPHSRYLPLRDLLIIIKRNLSFAYRFDVGASTPLNEIQADTTQRQISRSVARGRHKNGHSPQTYDLDKSLERL